MAQEIAAAGGRALPLVADVTSEHDMDELVRATIDRFSHLDVMICNAGFGIAGALDNVPADTMRRLLDVNFLGTYYAARAALPVFRRQGRGHLVIVSSIVGQRGVPFMSAYSATKFAQVGLAESLRAELAAQRYMPASSSFDRDRVFSVMRRETGADIERRMARAGASTSPMRSPGALRSPGIYPHALSRRPVWFNAIAPSLCDRFVEIWKTNGSVNRN